MKGKYGHSAENNSEEELKKDQAKAQVRLDRIKSAMKDEGEVVWSMEKANIVLE